MFCYLTLISIEKYIYIALKIKLLNLNIGAW